MAPGEGLANLYNGFTQICVSFTIQLKSPNFRKSNE